MIRKVSHQMLYQKAARFDNKNATIESKSSWCKSVAFLNIRLSQNII